MSSERCPICSSSAEVRKDPRDRYVVACENCGPFEISRSAYDDFGSKLSSEKAAILSHSVFKMNLHGRTAWLDTYTIQETLSAVKLPGHAEMVDNLVQFLGCELDRQNRPGGRILKLNFGLFRAAIGAHLPEDAEYIVQSLEKQGIVFIERETIERPGTKHVGCPAVGLTLKGWDRYRDLTTKGTSARVAFMAMQYGDSLLDKMYTEFFRPAVMETGFDLRRLDHVPKAGVIDNLLRAEILNCRFLLADLSHGNPGAYWEGGYAEGLGKPVIYLCEKSVFQSKKRRPHFDTNHCQTVVWAKDNPEECAKQLKAVIRVTLPTEARRSDT